MKEKKPKAQMRKKKTRIVGRDAKTGLFVPLKETVRRPEETIKQRITLPNKLKKPKKQKP